MALLCAGIDANIIKLVGRWRSDAMFRYLHAQALPIVKQLAKTMMKHGNFALAPGAHEPEKAKKILRSVTELQLQQEYAELPVPAADDDDD